MTFLTVSDGIPYGLRWYSLWSQMAFLTVSDGIHYVFRRSQMIFLTVFDGLRWYSLRSQMVFFTVSDGIPYGLRRSQMVFLTVSNGIPYSLRWYSLRSQIVRQIDVVRATMPNAFLSCRQICRRDKLSTIFTKVHRRLLGLDRFTWTINQLGILERMHPG